MKLMKGQGSSIKYFLCKFVSVEITSIQLFSSSPWLSFGEANYLHQTGAIFECSVDFVYFCTAAPASMSSCGERSCAHEAGVCAGAKLFSIKPWFFPLFAAIYEIFRGFESKAGINPTNRKDKYDLFCFFFLF